MRKIRKIVGNDRLIPIIKENYSDCTIIKKGYNSNKISRISVRTENIPIVQNNNNNVNLQRNKPNHMATVEPIWEGETVYIIGGGPSLIGFDWTRLSGKRTIAVNKSILSYPNADAMYWTDSRVYGWNKSEIDKFKGPKYTIRHHVTYPTDVKILRKSNKFGLEDSKDAICHGNNSGYAAINLAYLLGAKRIILLGYDMKNDGSRGHYHDGYPVPVTGNNIYKDQFIPGFQIIADLLRQKNIEVYNASMTSALTVWPKISFDKALSFN